MKTRTDADYWRPYCAPHKRRWLLYRRLRWAILTHSDVSPIHGGLTYRDMRHLFGEADSISERLSANMRQARKPTPSP